MSGDFIERWIQRSMFIMLYSVVSEAKSFLSSSELHIKVKQQPRKEIILKKSKFH